MIRIAAALALALAGLILLARALGSLLMPDLSPVAGDGRCVAPCWRGVLPGAVFIANANNILLSQGYTPQNSIDNRIRMIYQAPDETCTARLDHQDARVTEIRLSECNDLRLGDVMATLGPPDGFAPGAQTFVFASGSAVVRTDGDGCSGRLSLLLPVRSISLTPPGSTLRADTPWRGFMPAWAYRRLLPERAYLGC